VDEGEGRKEKKEGGGGKRVREKGERLRLTCKCVPHVYQRRNSIFE
jgi:hypothetical protein